MGKLMLQMVAVVLVLGVPFASLAGEPQEAAGKASPGPFEGPILVTAAGQSVDIKLAGVLLKRLDIPFDSNPTATAVDLEGHKTLLVVPGYSSKGLGAAGVSRDDELKRVKDLLAAAAEAKIPVLMMHLGGNARRGVQSDDFNALAAKAANLAIVVAQGDEDGFFTDLCGQAQVPLTVVPIIADAMKPLGEAFKSAEGTASEK
jgi:hypothetical protein